jgi:hypothetical protein
VAYLMPRQALACSKRYYTYSHLKNLHSRHVSIENMELNYQDWVLYDVMLIQAIITLLLLLIAFMNSVPWPVHIHN